MLGKNNQNGFDLIKTQKQNKSSEVYHLIKLDLSQMSRGKEWFNE